MPTMVTPGDLHLNQALSTVSTAYFQSEDAFISHKVFPIVQSQYMSGMFWKVPKGTYFRTDVQIRTPGAPANRTAWKTELDSYACEPYAIAQDIPDMHRANADSVFKLDAIATKQLTRQHLLHQEKAWYDKFFKTSTWARDITGAGSNPGAGQTLQWDNDNSDPIDFMHLLAIEQLERTGLEFNTLVTTPYVIRALLNHPLVLDRIKYVQTAMPMTIMNALATLLQVPRILVGKAVIGSHNDVDDSNPGNFSFIAGTKSALYCYTPDAPSVDTPAAGYTFAWTGLHGANAYGVRIKKYREERIASDVIEAEAAWSQKLVSADCGVFLHGIVS